MTPEGLNAYNLMVRRWASMVRSKLHGSVLRFSHGKDGAVTRGTKKYSAHTEYKLRDNISYKAHQDYGQIDGVGYQFERHGVFVHKGVGRGYVMSGGSVVLGRKPTNAVKAYAKQKNRGYGNTVLSGPVRRRPVEWFNPILDANVPELADKIAVMNADAAVNATKMRIN